MAQYNLTDNTNASFTFKLGELEFDFRYPTTFELREIGEISAELEKLAKEKEETEGKEGVQKDFDALIKAKSEESEAKMNALVTPVGHENSISDVLESQPINVVRNFRQMMAKEISLG